MCININYSVSFVFETWTWTFSTICSKELLRYDSNVPRRSWPFNVPDRSPFLTVTMIVPDRSWPLPWPFLTVCGTVRNGQKFEPSQYFFILSNSQILFVFYLYRKTDKFLLESKEINVKITRSSGKFFWNLITTNLVFTKLPLLTSKKCRIHVVFKFTGKVFLLPSHSFPIPYHFLNTILAIKIAFFQNVPFPLSGDT